MRAVSIKRSAYLLTAFLLFVTAIYSWIDHDLFFEYTREDYAKLARQAHFDYMAKHLETAKDKEKARAAEVLCEYHNHPQAVQLLHRLAQDDAQLARFAVARCLHELPLDIANPLYDELRNDKSPLIQTIAAQSMGHHPESANSNNRIPADGNKVVDPSVK